MIRRYPDLAVAVRADADAKQRDVVPVYGAINRAGVTNMAVLGLQNEKLR
jgi:biopolymer transport protein ExbD